MHNCEHRFWQHPYGVNKVQDGIQISFISEKEDCGIIFFHPDNNEEVLRVPFDKTKKVGNVYYMFLENQTVDSWAYLFYEEDNLIVDSYAGKYVGEKKYGLEKGPLDYKAAFENHVYDWEDDKLPMLSYEESIVYGMHVRGFTMHASSHVKGKGTFAGVVEKIPYLKELGITTVELQPIYEFNELPKIQKATNGQVLPQEQKLNYWGYQEAYYYAPKRSYSFREDSARECKDMIKTFHKNNMEVIMQVYFKDDMPISEIINVLRYWHIVYHVDGFHLIGVISQIKDVARDAFLKKCKLWYQYFPMGELYSAHEKPIYRNLATYNDGYMYDIRRFVKGDEAMLYDVMKHMRINPATNGVINYITNYYGLTMMDLVSYDRKYNEANGEDNKDGVDFNFSWNCGTEGVTRKKQILELREKQIKNLFTLLMLSQGTPLFFMGDEFGNSQKGNNNPYCQDNEIAWLNWKDLNKNKSIYSFVKELITFRKEHGVFHLPKECMIMDYKSCGCPDISYHGSEAWKPSWEHYSRYIGIMLCGEYAKGCEGSYYYIAINMHWEEHEFALPKLPKKKSWKVLFSTAREAIESDETKSNGKQIATKDDIYIVLKRSITVFEGV